MSEEEPRRRASRSRSRTPTRRERRRKNKWATEETKVEEKADGGRIGLKRGLGKAFIESIDTTLEEFQPIKQFQLYEV